MKRLERAIEWVEMIVVLFTKAIHRYIFYGIACLDERAEYKPVMSLVGRE